MWKPSVWPGRPWENSENRRPCETGLCYATRTMRQTLLNIALGVGILGFSAVVTQLFARVMYVTCSQCHTLNARRRSECRKCGANLRR